MEIEAGQQANYLCQVWSRMLFKILKEEVGPSTLMIKREGDSGEGPIMAQYVTTLEYMYGPIVYYPKEHKFTSSFIDIN